MEDLAACTGVNGKSKTDESASPAAHGVDSYCGSCLRSITRWIPVDFKNEIVHFLKLAGPVVISQMMSFLIGFVSMVFCGHLGKTELAGVALAIAVINVTGISIGCGLASACDTLISQTYGSGNLKRVGVILQRGVLILLLACFPCWAVLINTQPILLAVRQSTEVARLSQLYVKIFMPALPAAFMYQLQLRYLLNQGIMWPQVISGAMGNILNVIINYIFLNRLDLGITGSAAANAISQYSLAVFLFVYICFRGLHKATWDGWSAECLQEWGPFLRLAIPSMLMLCLEWWLYEIAGFLAGIISEVELGAQSIVYQLASIAYMFPMGISVAASIRVGNALGAGNTEQAKLSSKVSFICACCVSCLIGVVLIVFKDLVGYIFTTEKDIIQRVSDVMKMYGVIHVAEAIAVRNFCHINHIISLQSERNQTFFFFFFTFLFISSPQGVTGGIVRGTGKQMIGAVCNLVGFYLIGLPIGVSLMFPVQMGIVGLWSGLLISVLIQSVFFIVFLCKLNWTKVTEEALIRAGVHITERNKIFGIENKAPDSGEKQGHVRSSSLSGVEGKLEGQQTSDDVVLSVRQLVVRRGLAVLLMFIILAAGVFISELLIRLLELDG
ncbi:multidrug and toxin extrusion protein 1-like isoform X2 [Trematomus bernacchii]|uniref:multidrug and toxin extrusion protein 1-like isoform X2 n=1 Tax=Trematomus bernacchii TaxID=40690 RepID=UPI00146AF481|nr:multidrug and toxin extrusion protein 1-like isoform X2 [Trematomus bernacchii]XP_033996121.1 multidrug and toxin extrusion protein 1-like isoform X2 [Trematomus bernacchii]